MVRKQEFGLGLRTRRAEGSAVPAEALALIARMTVPPDGARRLLIARLVSALIAADVWHRLDGLWLMAAHDGQAARINWKQALHDLTLVNSPAFTVDRGYATDGVASYLDPGFNPAAAGGRFQQASAHMGFWSRTAARGGAVDMGTVGSLLTARNGSDLLGHRINWSMSNSGAAVDGSGHFVTSRVGPLADDNAFYRNSSVVFGNVPAGTLQALENTPLRIGRRATEATYSARQFAAAHLGGGLTVAHVTALHAALNAYLAALGAA